MMKWLPSFPSPISHFLWVGLLWLLSLDGELAQAKNLSPDNILTFENLSGKHGLPQSLVWCIEQDQEGFMWFGTENGLYKYDGRKATHIQADPADPDHSLRNNFIIDIHEDRTGRLWIATLGGGLHQINKLTGKIHAYPINAQQTYGWNQLESIYEDRQGILWLGTGLGIARFDPITRKYTLYPSPNGKFIIVSEEDEKGRLWASNEEGVYQFEKTGRYTLFSLPVNHTAVWALHLDTKGTLWAASLNGLFRLNTHIPEKLLPYAPEGIVLSDIWQNGIYEAGGYMWLATGEGLKRIDTKLNKVNTFTSDPSLPGSLSSTFTTSLYQDRTGNLWVGTMNGVNKASIRHKPFYTHQIIPTPTSFHRQENTIVSVLEDHTGTLWLGSSARGLYQLDTSTQQLIPVLVNPTVHDTLISFSELPLAEDQQGYLWVGTDSEKGLYQLDRATGKFIRYASKIQINKLEADPSGKLWLCGWLNEMAVFDPSTEKFTYYQSDESNPNSLIPGYINDLMVSRTGEIWVASFRGISRFTPKTGRFIRYQVDSHYGKAQLTDQNVQTLYEDREGIIWIGTSQGGLNRFDPHTNTFSVITTKQGLPSNRITSIIEDRHGNLWLATNMGLCRFNPKTNTFRNFDASDGLPGNEFLVRGSVFSRNGKIFFGHKNGLVSFNPNMINDTISVPPVYITGFKVLEQSRALTNDTIELSYQENFLSFEFIALNYDSPEKTRYTYKLDGLEKDWVQSGSQQVARYTDLTPGKYIFRIKAANSNGMWAEKALYILISPPWWFTTWAYMFYGLCFLAGILMVDRYQRRRLIQREREKARERELEQAKEIEKANKELALQKEELQSTLEHLKTTQSQLIAQEKAGLENELKVERLQKQQELASYQNKMSELEMMALRAQMNPHFIFNCLNSIDRFILKNESEAASDYLTKFSKLIRLILQNSQSRSVPLDRELDALKLYIDMEVLRFDGQFTYQIKLDPHLEVEEVQVPPLIIQPYVENAIWHGLMHKQGEGHLLIELQLKADRLYCQITDDGVGRKRAGELKSKSASKSKSMGMQITAHRLELINALQEKATTVEVLDLVDASGEPCGTKVVLNIPV